MKVFITGVTGMIGSYMAEYVIKNNLGEVSGFKRWRSDVSSIRHLLKNIQLFDGDITDHNSVKIALSKIKPDFIFHFAAQAFNSISWEAYDITLRTNINGTVNLFEAVKELDLIDNTKILVAGSSAEYGYVGKEPKALDENTDLRPISPYGVSKVTQELLSYQYSVSYGHQYVVPRLFIQIGPRHPEIISVQAFAKQIAAIKVLRCPPVINVGNLSTSRDFLDVRDGVAAMWLLMNKGENREAYNICSGIPYKLRDMLESLIDIAHIKVDMKVDKQRFRPVDEEYLLGDNIKLKTATGWKPNYTIERTLSDILHYWEKVLRQEH